MIDDAKDLLIERALGTFRERNAAGRILPSPAWWDLSGQDRESLFECQLESRILERSLRPEGWSATVQAVLERLR
jgi:hypothetical protein